MATSCILDAVNSVLAQIGEIPFDWSAVPYAEKSRPANLFQLVRIWNDQVNREAREKNSEGVPGYVFEKPACFLEMMPGETSQFLDNVTNTEYTWKLRIVDMELDAGDDVNMDQNLTVFGYRDTVKALMVGFQPANCSTLFFINEWQDYDHSGIYHYIVELKCCFIDTKGSVQDPDQTKVIYKQPPTNLELVTSFDDGITPPADPQTSYIWQDRAIRVSIVDVPDPTNTQDLGNGVTIPVEYALNADGTLTIPYLNTVPGVSVLTPFIIGSDPADTVVYMWSDTNNAYVFDNSAGGGFVVGNQCSFNASLPNL